MMSLTQTDYSAAIDGTRVIAEDPWLKPYEQTLQRRYVL